MVEIDIPFDVLEAAAKRANEEERSLTVLIAAMLRDYADGTGETLWTAEVRDTATGPWRLMSSEGRPDSMVFAFRTEAEAEEMTTGFERSRVTEWKRVAGDG